MIANLHIERFRGIRDVELNDLGQVNLVVGQNNAGKTSVLEALAIYANPLDPLAWYATAMRRDGGMSDVEAIGWLFPQVQGKAVGEIYLHGDGPLSSVRASVQELAGGVQVLVEASKDQVQRSLSFELWDDERLSRSKDAVPPGWSLPVFSVIRSDRRAAADQLRQYSERKRRR